MREVKRRLSNIVSNLAYLLEFLGLTSPCFIKNVSQYSYKILKHQNEAVLRTLRRASAPKYHFATLFI